MPRPDSAASCSPAPSVTSSRTTSPAPIWRRRCATCARSRRATRRSSAAPMRSASLASEKMSELAQTVELSRAGQKDAALAIVSSDRGNAAMQRIRITVDELVRSEQAALAQRQAEWQEAVQNSALISGGGSAVLIFLIAAAALAASRDYRTQKAQAWMRTGQVGLAETLAGEQRLDAQADRALAYLAHYLQAQVGAFYVADEAAASGAPPVTRSTRRMSRASSPAPTCWPRRRRTIARCTSRTCPTATCRSARRWAAATPRELLIAPASVDGVVHAVVELGFLRARRRRRPGAARPRLRNRSAIAVRAVEGPHAARGAARGDAAPGRGAADAAGGAARQQRGARGAGPRRSRNRRRRLEIPAGRARADQLAARGAGRRCSSSRRTTLADAQAASGREGRRARAREPVQERVPRQHEPRAAHAAQLVADPGEAARRQQATATSPPSRSSSRRRSPRPATTCWRSSTTSSICRKIEAGKVEVDAGAGARFREWSTALIEDLRAGGAGERLCASASTIEPAHAGADRHRSAAARRRFSRTCCPTRSKFTETRRSRRCACSRAADGDGVVCGARHRHRHPGASAGGDLRGVPAGRRQHPPQVRRHRARAVDLARSGASARRRHHRAERRRARAARSR